MTQSDGHRGGRDAIRWTQDWDKVAVNISFQGIVTAPTAGSYPGRGPLLRGRDSHHIKYWPWMVDGNAR